MTLYHPYSSCLRIGTSLFNLLATMHQASRTKFEWHPKTWKMYLAMNVAFTIAGYPLGDLWLLAPDGRSTSSFSRTAPMANVGKGDTESFGAGTRRRLRGGASRHSLLCALALCAVDQVIKPDRFRFGRRLPVLPQTASVRCRVERACRRRCGVARCVKTSGRDSTTMKGPASFFKKRRCQTTRAATCTLSAPKITAGDARYKILERRSNRATTCVYPVPGIVGK